MPLSSAISKASSCEDSFLLRDPALPYNELEKSRRNKGKERDGYICTRCSFRILILTPWSENERERNVDSNMPGKVFEGYT